jgi:hypothetical protein
MVAIKYLSTNVIGTENNTVSGQFSVYINHQKPVYGASFCQRKQWNKAKYSVLTIFVTLLDLGNQMNLLPSWTKY